MLFYLVLLYSMSKATEAHINFSKKANQNRSLLAQISVNALKLLGNPEEIVFDKYFKKIREASISDRKVSVLSGTGNTFSVTGNDAEELLGYWNVELNDKGELELYREEAA
jgi:hypothetical protein